MLTNLILISHLTLTPVQTWAPPGGPSGIYTPHPIPYGYTNPSNYGPAPLAPVQPMRPMSRMVCSPQGGCQLIPQ